MSARARAKEFSRWLRSNAEHWLLVDAQARMAARYGRPVPPKPKSPQEFFWLRVFAPTYRRLPWKFRSALIARMPGSHRQGWAPPERPRGPAV